MVRSFVRALMLMTLAFVALNVVVVIVLMIMNARDPYGGSIEMPERG